MNTTAPTHFTTKRDAIETLILGPLTSSPDFVRDTDREGAYADYDIDAIADEVLTYDSERHEFTQAVSVDEFWEIVERHARD